MYKWLAIIICFFCGVALGMTFTACEQNADDDDNDDDATDDETTDDDATDDDATDDDATDDDDDDDDDDDNDDNNDNDDTTDMVYVSEGIFQMGCETEDGECDADESPRHEVDISAYYIDINEVTNSRYVGFLNDHGNDCDGYECVDADSPDFRISESGGVWSVDPGYEDHPVVVVSWYGGKVFCESNGGRLPTEAEWEKAAKGAAEHYIYPWGDALVANTANYLESGDPFDDGTTPVGYYDGSNHEGTYQTVDGRSSYGAHDMAGNVYEWVNDWYDENYYTTSPYNDPQGPTTGSGRVLRGGSFLYSSKSIRASNRGGRMPDNGFNGLGFRCAWD